MALLNRLLLLGMPFILMACGASTTKNVSETPSVAQETQAASTAQAAFPTVDFQGVRFTNPLPETVAMGRSVEATPPPSPDDLPGDASPAHVLFEFQPYYPQAFQENLNLMPAQLAVYSTEQFAEYEFDTELAQLTELLKAQPDLSQQTELPYLPLIAAGQIFHAADTYLEFKGGSGIRYITAYSQDVGPITEEQLFYTFQGLTDNGRYISATFPIKTANLLPTTPDSLVGSEYDAFSAQFDTYLAEIRDRISNADPATDFTPPLTELDALIQSLQVE
ncbi:MAG TPA: hypothetical protein V6D07_08045 [Trichocoleus sp.]